RVGGVVRLWVPRLFARPASWPRRIAARARTPTRAAPTRPASRKSSARRQSPKKCAAGAKLFSDRSDASRSDGILAFAITNHRTECRVFRRARSTPTRAPHAGAAPVGALAAPTTAAGAARKPARADGVLRAAGNSHGDVSGR